MFGTGARAGLVGIVAVAGIAAFGAAPASAQNVAPDCPSYSETVQSGQPLVLTPRCTDDDGPSQPLFYSLVQFPEFGTIFATDSSGNATYTSFVGFGGTDTFKYQASDGQATSNAATVTVTVTGGSGNQEPSCPDADAFVLQGQSVDLFGNCVDPENNPIQYTLDSAHQPQHGSLQILSLSSVRYEPFGPPAVVPPASDSFGYFAKDQLHSKQSVVVDISILAAGTTTFPPAPQEATPTDPLQASVITPTAPATGVNIDRRPTTSTPELGFFLLGEEFDITAPPADATNPLKLVFTLDGSIDIGGLVILRDEQPVAPACDPGTAASPDPCVESIDSSSGDHVITIRTSHASDWSFAIPEHVVEFGGFAPPVDDRPAESSAKAGSTVPVKFTLGEDEGDDPFAAGYPKSEEVDCGSSDDVGGTDAVTSPGASALQHDGGAYRLNWKTEKNWSGTCRQLVLRFDDSAQTEARSDFRFE